MFEMGCIEDPDDGFEIVHVSGEEGSFKAIERKVPDSEVRGMTPAKFLEFHTENRSVYSALVEFAFQAKRAGKRKTGMTFLMNRVRWHEEIDTNRTDDFKINDHLSPYYARLIMAEYEELQGMFELRETIAADDWIIGLAPDSWVAEEIHRLRTTREANLRLKGKK